jgi:hypothetical protein
MYGWLWRHLPGPVSARVGQLAGLGIVVVVVCVHWVYPALADLIAPAPDL